jgi:ArsR family transcriptional regulator
MAIDNWSNDDEANIEAFNFDASIKAIAHPLRRQILMWLRAPQLYFPDQRYGQELGVCVGQITQRCSLSKSTVSVHLNALRAGGLVDLHKAGSVHFYKRNEDAIHCFGSHFRSSLKGG